MAKKKVDEKQQNSFLVKVKKILNNPLPMLIILTLIIVFLLMYIANYDNKNKIFVGVAENKDIQIVNVHYFTNGDMNYFYASNAAYIGKDKDIYSYQIGYYVVDKNDNYIELATRSGNLSEKASLKEILEEMSGWNFPEPDKANYFFTDQVMRNMDNLHFVVKASTKEDSKEADVYYDLKVDATKITK